MTAPHKIVAFAPKLDPSLTIVFLNSDFLSTPLLGFITFVKTTLGPPKHNLQKSHLHINLHYFVFYSYCQW